MNRDRLLLPVANPGFDRFFLVALLVVSGWLLALTIPDYGIMWDCWEFYLGDHYLYYLTSFNPAHLDVHADSIPLYHRLDHPDFHAVTTAYPDNDVIIAPHLTFPIGPLSVALSKSIFFTWLGLFDPFDAGHMAMIPYVLVLLFVVVRMSREDFGRWVAVVAGVLVMSHPRFWSDMHNNIKDTPTVTWFALTIWFFMRGVDRRHLGWLLASGACWGLGLATKPNGFFLPFILGPWFVYRLWQRYRRGESLLRLPEWIGLGLYPLMGLVFLLILWPLVWSTLPGSFFTLWHSWTSRGFSESESHWNAVALLKVLYTTPPVFLAALALGLSRIAWSTWQNRSLNDRHLVVVLWFVVPILRICMPGAKDFDGIRHWLEFIPAAAIIAGIGVAPWLDRLAGTAMLRPANAVAGTDIAVATTTSTAAEESPASPVQSSPAASWWAGWGRPCALPLLAIAAALTPTWTWMVRNHPFEVVYFNSFIGGLGGAQRAKFPDSCDYWCNSYRAGFEMINANAAKGATLYLGTAEHIGFYTREVWLNSDIHLQNAVGKSEVALIDEISATPGEVYVMYIDRPDMYNVAARLVDGRKAPVYTIDVDGGRVLTIVQLK